MTPQPPDRSDPRALLWMLWRWKLLFLAILLVAPAIAFLIVHNKPKVYESSALVSVQGATGIAPGGSGTTFATANIFAIARLVNTSAVADTAAKLLTPPVAPGAIPGSVSASGDTSTNFITITAQAHDPRKAADIANAFAKALGVNRTNAEIGAINSQIAILQNQLTATPPGPANQGARQQLQQQLLQLRAARGSQSGSVSTVQPAAPNFTAVSPHVRRTVELGFVIGLLIAIGAVALAENSDRRLRSPSDLEEMTGLPLLSAIPSRAFSVPVHSTGTEEEAFQMLRADLTYFNIDRRLGTIVVTSAGQRDGKTTVAMRLALAMARAGKRIVLVDADLRRSQISERLGTNSSSGLAAVLVGEARLSEVMFDHPVDMAKGGRLMVVPAGPPPPNPSELLSSQEMRRLIPELEAHGDLVIIDTPAALAVSDAIPLLALASGTIMIARMNQTTRDSVRRLQRVITTANGTILGVVATATGSGPGYEDYGYGYGGNGKPRRQRRRWLGLRGDSSAPTRSGADVELNAMPTEPRDA